MLLTIMIRLFRRPEELVINKIPSRGEFFFLTFAPDILLTFISTLKF